MEPIRGYGPASYGQRESVAEKVFGIPPEAAPAWRRLQAGRRLNVTPCDGRPEWISESRTDRREAARLCAGCPIADLCGTYASTADERAGVWAGHDMTSPAQRKALRDQQNGAVAA